MSLARAVLPALMVLLGVALILRTVSAGGGVLAVGVVMGALFVAGGALRLWAERQER